MKMKITLSKIPLIKKTYVTLCFILLISSTIFSQTIVERGGRLQVDGSHVTTENGQKVSLAGNSLFWSNAGDTSDYYNAQTVNHLADDWNSAIIRPALGVKETWDNGTGYIDNPQQQTAKIRKVIDAAIAKGVYVIIDWHTHLAERYPNEAARFFGEMAEIYGEYDNIIYEIYNEPFANTQWNTVKNYAGPVIAAIRAKDPDNLIIVGTRNFSQEVEEAADSPITGDPNLAYTLHYYANTHFKWLRDRAERAMNKGIALFVTEYGTTDASGDGGFNSQESKVWFDFLIDNDISYVNWTISDKDEDSCAVRPGMGTQGLINTQLTQSGNFVRDHMRSRNYDDITGTLSTNDFSLDGSSVILHPNPVISQLHIKTNSGIEKISIFDIMGRLVLSENLNGSKDEVEINIESFTSGNYLLQLESSKGDRVTKKIIKL